MSKRSNPDVGYAIYSESAGEFITPSYSSIDELKKSLEDGVLDDYGDGVFVDAQVCKLEFLKSYKILMKATLHKE